MHCLKQVLIPSPFKLGTETEYCILFLVMMHIIIFIRIICQSARLWSFSFVMFIFLQQIKTFKDYVGLYLKGRDDEEELALDSENKKPSNSVVHEVVNNRWEVCVTTSMKGFQQASFVNSIATTKVHVH